MTSGTSHLAESERVIVALLAFLWERGFQKGIISFEDLKLPEESAIYYGESVRWLIDEKLVRTAIHHETSSGETTLLNPVLTAKGFDILKKPNPTGVGTLGERLKPAVVAAGAEAGRAAIQDIIGQIVHAAVNHFPT